MATILTTYYRPKPGGLCKRLFRAIHALLASGHSVHYLAAVPFPITHERCHFHRFPWPRDRTSGLLFWSCYAVLAPFQLLYIGLRYRVTHAFAFGTTYAALLQPLRFLAHVPLSVFLRADVIQNHILKDRSAAVVRTEMVLEGLAIRNARVFPVSKALAEVLAKRHPKLKTASIEVLPNDMGTIEPPRQSTRSNTSPLEAASVGVLESRKNQGFLLDVVEHLTASEIRLSLYGDGPDRSALAERIDRRGIGDRVRLAGWIQPAARIWNNTDLLLFPSLHEGSPNAILESVAHGVPVLASDTPEHRELLPPEALLDLAHPSNWASSIRALTHSPDALRKLLEAERLGLTPLVFDWDKRIERAIVA